MEIVPRSKGIRRRRNSRKMEERRRRILDAARSIILVSGVDGLNMRELASVASVAIRTIYSLIGRKVDVLIALYVEFHELYMEKVETHLHSNAIDRMEGIITEAVELASTNAQFSRAAYLVIEHLDDVKPPHPAVNAMFATASLFVSSRFQTAIDDKLLSGRISAQRLAVVMVYAYRGLWRKWAAARISLDQLQQEGLISLWIVMMADANKEIKDILIEKVRTASLSNELKP